MRKTCDETGANRIDTGRHHDRDCLCSFHDLQCSGCRWRDNDIQFEVNQLCCEIRESLWCHFTGRENEHDIFAFHVAQFAQSLAERLPQMNTFRDRAGRKNTDTWYLPCLLTLGRHAKRKEHSAGKQPNSSGFLNVACCLMPAV